MKCPEHTAEVEEGREVAKGKTVAQNRVRTQRRSALPRALDRIRAAARRDRPMPLTALWHHVYDLDRLREAYDGLNREASPGVDGETWARYGANFVGRCKSRVTTSAAPGMAPLPSAMVRRSSDGTFLSPLSPSKAGVPD